MRLIRDGLRILSVALMGMVGAWLLFVVVDWVLSKTANLDLYYQGELLIDALFKPNDSLVLGYLLFFWVGTVGAFAGATVGVFRVARHGP